METYIKLFRRIQNWGWYKDPITKAVFIEFLLRARYEPGEYRGIMLQPGQCVVGRKELAEVLGLSERSVRTALEHLKSTNEIATKSTNKFTIVTIVNWVKWQGDNVVCDQDIDQHFDQQPTNNRPTTDQQPTTNKERKESKEGKNIKSSSSGEPLWKRLSQKELELLDKTFLDADDLIAEVSKEAKLTDRDIKKPCAYIVKWAQNNNWPRRDKWQ